MFIKIGNLKQEEYNGIQEMAAFGLHRWSFRNVETIPETGNEDS